MDRSRSAIEVAEQLNKAIEAAERLAKTLSQEPIGSNLEDEQAGKVQVEMEVIDNLYRLAVSIYFYLKDISQQPQSFVLTRPVMETCKELITQINILRGNI